MAHTQTILGIDDRREALAAIQATIEAEGYRIITAANTSIGRRMIRSAYPDMLLIGLPLSEVFTLLQNLHTDSHLAPLPVIVLLRSWASETEVKLGWELGVDAFLPVDFDPRELLLSMQRIFQSQEEERSAGI